MKAKLELAVSFVFLFFWIGLILWGLISMYSCAKTNEALAEQRYETALKQEQGKPVKRVRAIDVPQDEDRPRSTFNIKKN